MNEGAEHTSEWQPIETAPTDGTRVLGWNGTEVSVMCHEQYRDGRLGHWAWEADLDEGGYATELDHRSGTQLSPTVTHWQPLPTPPKVPMQSGEAA